MSQTIVTILPSEVIEGFYWENRRELEDEERIEGQEEHRNDEEKWNPKPDLSSMGSTGSGSLKPSRDHLIFKRTTTRRLGAFQRQSVRDPTATESKQVYSTRTFEFDIENHPDRFSSIPSHLPVMQQPP